MMPDIRPGAVTAADVMHQLGEMGRDLKDAGRAIGAANTRLAVIDERTANAASDLADHENRIRTLEGFRNKVLGISVVVSMASGAISGLVGYVLGHLH